MLICTDLHDAVTQGNIYVLVNEERSLHILLSVVKLP